MLKIHYCTSQCSFVVHKIAECLTFDFLSCQYSRVNPEVLHECKILSELTATPTFMINDQFALNVKEQAVRTRNTCTGSSQVPSWNSKHSSLRLRTYCDVAGSRIASSCCRGFTQHLGMSMLTLVNWLPFSNFDK